MGSMYYILIIVLFGGMYFMMFRSEKKKRAKFDDMINGIKVNDEVLTRGGIIGRVISIKDDIFVIESGPDRVKLRITKRGIAEVMAKEDIVNEN